VNIPIACRDVRVDQVDYQKGQEQAGKADSEGLRSTGIVTKAGITILKSST
jgi:hypothetical protein